MIVVGGSFGGCEALQHILGRLPATFPLPIAVALHRHRDSEGLLAPVLQRSCALNVCDVEDKTLIRSGYVFVCPPDYHLMIDADSFALSTDAPVNFARPSIDVLFESAAEWTRQSLIAVVLTGAGNDGARGARKVAECGGQVLIQDPKSAAGSWMPNAAIASTPSARVLNLDQITEVLLQAGSRS